MSEEPENSAPDPAPAEAAPSAPTPPTPHRNRFLIGTLFTLATIIGVFAVLAVWANRQALNTDSWTATSSQLLADQRIQAAVAATTVDSLFKSGVVQSELKSVLPTKLQPIAGPAAAGLQQIASQLAPRLLASPQVQAAWVAANRAAHRVLLKIINGGNNLASTNGGTVTLDLHAIVAALASALGVQSQVASAQAALKSNAGKVSAAAGTLGITLPPSSGKLVILRSSQLKAVQDGASAIKGLALVLPLLAFALFILAVWLSRGHRREALRMTGWCFVGIGLLVLIARRVLGNYIVDALVKNPVNRPAGHDVWTIGTTLLYDIAVALVAYGLVFVVAAWLGGRTRPAKALRHALAPTLRHRPIATYIAAYIALLLVILWGPTPATRQIPYIIGFIVLLAIGVRALRRQTDREFPDAQPGDSMRAIRSWNAERRAPRAPTVDPAPAGPNAGRVAELERLALLHDRGALTDAEFATEKAVLLNGGS
ncbi:MAG TPA: SHOCT domain-containing protein [Solirubrobacteraceae bacterium]